MALGLAIAKFVEYGRIQALAAGALLMAVGALGLAYAAARYWKGAADIRRDRRVITQGRTRGSLAAGMVMVVAFTVALLLLW